MADKKDDNKIRLNTDLEWGQVWYIKNDPEQLEHLLVGVIIRPKKTVKFILDFMGEEAEVYDFECSLERDMLKALKAREDNNDDVDE